MHDSSFAPCSVGPSSWLHSKAKGLMAEWAAAWPDPKGAQQHDWSGQGQEWLGPGQSGGWTCDRQWSAPGDPGDPWQSYQRGEQQAETGDLRTAAWNRSAYDESRPPVAGGGKGRPSHNAVRETDPLWAPDMHQCTSARWGPAEDKEAQARWLTQMNAELHKLGIATAQPVTMATFNQSLADVVDSHSEAAIQYRDRRRFNLAGWGTTPSKSWKAGCFCPVTPAEKVSGNEIGQDSVDWTYHLAAVLRLIRTGEQRRQYLIAKHLTPDNKSSYYVVFFNGMAVGMASIFKHLLGTLNPPVQLEERAEPVQTGKGGHKGRPETASYRMQVKEDQANQNQTVRKGHVAVVQLVLAFHQRLAQWPGRYSHTKCYPWVISQYCKTGMHHPPLILVELALGAWGMKAEEHLPRFGNDLLACNLGAMESPGNSATPLALRKMRADVVKPMCQALCRAGQPETWLGLMNAWAGDPADAPTADDLLGPAQPEDTTAVPGARAAAAAAQDATAAHLARTTAARAQEEKDKKGARAAEGAASTPSTEASALELLEAIKVMAGNVSSAELGIMVSCLLKQRKAEPASASASQDM